MEKDSKRDQDWLLRYGILLDKRFTEKQRVNFLRSAQIEFDQMNFATETTSSELSAIGAKRKFYNLYAGNLRNPKVLLMTYYDTPAKTFGLYKETAFQNYLSRFSMFVNLLPSLAMLLVFGFVIFFWLMPRTGTGAATVWWLPTIALAVMGLFLITRYRSGIPRRSNMVRNTSSILAMLTLAEKFDRSDEIAFAFVDGGIDSVYGLQMAQKYFKGKSKKVINLDSIGNEGDSFCFTNLSLGASTNVKVLPLPESWGEKGDMLLTAGQFEKNKVLIRKNNHLDKEKIHQLVDYLESLVNEIL
jgi:hypothetical protein